ncbi:MAG: hypothetical protein A3J30_02530 [Candidatus Wildermuthbacteria bacterium RIFCSPLOWO2_02_FULL_47_9c]|uniref:Uncharacterized protein n=3 Tax=Parcubacteria group TaxID=1794811 RepID=A0A0G1XEL3_9BACT|nr:MAG: hypothetical protein UY25_C0002G0139 [Candidatus Yanofskybacteria bacterium GW2011_GWC1_48_11]KKW04612.1 MAG: hypothetical protein UY38_C0001G0179 [Parcubacteria group bacterium GW2011_GWB1_49_12]KKW09130.1 MAG: hypothetical protein UY45_C0001G0016 [Parcubacteria group bacterium GW2011_GWA1_49_26]KKW13599.1 MAG: hypothetical protein UY53_C0010G0008 [Parcubacteria group bacterium GW2011_GWA2_50_10]KKW29391.1 MAG: hypothetical protein UY74_C0077G0009 [Candidatus Kaiserbacteria bacterium G
MVDVWIITPKGTILIGKVSKETLNKIGDNALPDGSEITLVVDERHGISEGAVVPVKDLWVKIV